MDVSVYGGARMTDRVLLVTHPVPFRKVPMPWGMAFHTLDEVKIVLSGPICVSAVMAGGASLNLKYGPLQASAGETIAVCLDQEFLSIS